MKNKLTLGDILIMVGAVVIGILLAGVVGKFLAG